MPGDPVPRPPAGRVGAGCTVRLVEGDPQSVVIRFFDGDGLDLSEDGQRKIERLFTREDFRRVFPGEIGDIGFPPRALEHYTAALEATVDVEPGAADAGFKVVVDYGYGSTSFVMPNVLAKLGADVLAVNPYASTAGADGLRPGRPRRAGGRPGAGVGRARRRRHRPRRRAPHAHRRRGPRARATPRPCSPSSACVGDHLVGDQVALPVAVDPPRRGARRSQRASGALTRRCRRRR